VTEQRWPTHAAADLFPLLADDELRLLADDIAKHGLVEPVWLWDDPERGAVLLDGRNRVTACGMADVKLRTRKYTGSDPITFSISQNMRRRHLTTGQKAAVGAAAEPLYAAEAKRRMLAGAKPAADPEADPPQGSNGNKPKRAPQARDKAAKTAGTSGRSVAQFKRIEQQAPDLAEKVKAGHHAEYSRANEWVVNGSRLIAVKDGHPLHEVTLFDVLRFPGSTDAA
jgi:hypothetical protein